jgi:hypothetical protein
MANTPSEIVESSINNIPTLKVAPSHSKLIEILIEDITTKVDDLYEQNIVNLRKVQAIVFTSEDCKHTLQEMTYTLCNVGSSLFPCKGFKISPLDTKLKHAHDELTRLEAERARILHYKSLLSTPRKFKTFITKKLIEQTQDGVSLIESLQKIADNFVVTDVKG